MSSNKYRRKLDHLARSFGRRLEINSHCQLIDDKTGHKVWASGTPRQPEIALRATERLLRRFEAE